MPEHATNNTIKQANKHTTINQTTKQNHPLTTKSKPNSISHINQTSKAETTRQQHKHPKPKHNAILNQQNQTTSTTKQITTISKQPTTIAIKTKPKPMQNNQNNKQNITPQFK